MIKFCESCQLETEHILAKVYDEDEEPGDGTETLICQRCGHSDLEPSLVPDPIDLPNLGLCCECGSELEVRNVIFINKRLPEKYQGLGWGCLICNLPADGAVVVLCENCFKKYTEPSSEAERLILSKCCAGYPKDNIRIEMSNEWEDFRHGPGHELPNF